MAQVKDTTIKSDGSSILKKGSTLTSAASSPTDKIKQRQFYRSYASGLLDESRITDNGWKAIYEYQLENGLRDLSEIDTSVLKKYNVNTSLARPRVSEPIELETPNIEAGPTNPDVKETGFLGKLLQSFRTQNAPEQADRLRPITEEFGKQMEVTNQGLKEQIKNANAPYEGKDMKSLIQDKDPLLMALNNKLGNASMGEQVGSFLDSYRTNNNIKPNVAQNDGPSYLKGESKSNIDANNNGGYMPKSPMVNPLAAHTTQQTFKYDGKIEPALHFKLGQLNADLGAEYTKKMYGKPNRVEELTKEYQTLIEANPHLIESRINLDTNFWEFAAAGIEGTAQQAGMHSTYWGESAGSAALGATLGGVTALALGNLGPQALTQVDDAVLLPYMMKKGAQLFAGAQSFENMFEIEAGLAYKDMLDQNIPEDRAKGYATLVGLINAGIEVNQLGDVIKSYPGLKQTLQGITKKGLEEATEKFVKKEGKHLIADYAKFVLGETGQEVVQEIVPIVATEKAKGRTISQSINALSTPENLGRMFDTAAQSIATFMFMGLGSVGTNIISTRSNNKNTQAVFDHMGRIESVVDKVSFRDFQDMGDDTKKTIFAYKGTLDTAIKNKLFDEEGTERAQVLSDKIESLMVNKSVEKEEMEIINEKGHAKILPTFKSNLDALDITMKAVQNPTDEETQIAKENIDAFMADPKVQKLLTFFNGIDTKVPQGSINAKMAEFNTIYDNYFNREEESDIEGEILQNEAAVDVGRRRESDEIINLDQQGQQGVQGPVPAPPSLEQPSPQTEGYSGDKIVVNKQKTFEEQINDAGKRILYSENGKKVTLGEFIKIVFNEGYRFDPNENYNFITKKDGVKVDLPHYMRRNGITVSMADFSSSDREYAKRLIIELEEEEKKNNNPDINETNVDDKLDDIEIPTEEEIIAEYEADNPKTLDEYLVSMASMHEKYSEEDKAALVEFTERMTKLNVDQMRKQGYEISDSNAEKWKMSYFENGAELLDAIRNRDFQELRERLADNSNKASRGLFTRITGLPTDNQTITFESIKKLDPEAYAKYEVDKKASQEEAKAKAAEEAKAAKEAEKAEKERLVGGNRMMWKGKAMDLSEMVQVLFDEGYRVTNQNDYGGYDISNGDDTFDKERLSKDERSYLKKHLLRLQQEEWDKADQEEWDSLTQEEQEANNHLFGTNIPTKADIAAKAESSSKTTEKDYETFFQETYNTIVNRMEADGEDSEIAESISGKAKDNAIEDIKSLVIRNINKLFYGKDIPLTENIRKMVDDQELYKVANRIYDEFNQLFETSIPTKTVTAVKAKYDSPYLNEMDPYSPSGVSVSEFLPYNKSGGNTIFKMGEYYTNGHFMIHDSALNSALRKRFEKYAEEKDQAATDRLMNMFSDTVSGMNDSKNDYVLPLLSDDNRVLAYEPETFSPMLYNTKYFNYIHNVLGLQIAFFGGDTKPSVLYKDHVPVGMLMPLRFGPDKPASDEIRQYIENSKIQSSDSTIKVEETKTEPERKPDFGYHAGDLGKAESFWRIKSGNRSTGHFGTGTYFVGNENKMVGVGFEDRPKHKIDFSNYKLYKPATWLESEALHDALKFINYNYSDIKSIEEMIRDSKQIEHIEEVMYEYDKAATLLAGEMNEEYLDVLKDFEKNGAVLKKFIDETPLLSEKDKKESMELAKNKYSNDGYILMAKYYGNLMSKIEDNLSSRGFAYEAIYDYESFQTNLERSRLDVSLDRAKEIMAYIASEVKMNLGDDWFNNDKAMSFDSPSTMFMKALGYEGVDVRHINSFDNTAYGSVIYDLKSKDAEYAQANKRQPIEDEPTESVPMGKAGESENTLTPADVIESMYEIIQGITDVSTFKIFEGLDEVVSDLSDLDKNTDKQKIVLNELNKIVGEDKSQTLLDFLMSEVEFINNENDKELNGLNHPSTKIYLADIMESLERDLEDDYDTDYEFFTSYSGDLFTIINDDDENVMGNIGTETAHDLVTSGKSRRSLYEEIKETIPDRNNYRIRMYNLIMNKAKQMAYGDTKEASNNAKALSDYGMSISEDSTKTGTKVWNVSGNTKDYKDILKRGVLGGNWYGPKKVWSFSPKQYPTIESLENAILKKIRGMEVVENVEDTTTPPVSDTPETGYTIDEMTNIVRDRLKDIAPDGWKNGNLMKERTVRQQIAAILEKNGVPQEEQIDMAVKIFDTLKKEKDITDLISDVADEVVKDQKPKKPSYIFFNDLMEEMKDELSELGLADESEVDEIIEINDKVGIGAVNDLSTNYHQETGIKNMLNRVFDSEVADKIYELILSKTKQQDEGKVPNNDIGPKVIEQYKVNHEPSQYIADRVKEHLSKGEKFTYVNLFNYADKGYNGTQANHDYEVKDAYDGLELGVNQYLLEQESIDLTNTVDLASKTDLIKDDSVEAAIETSGKLVEMLDLIPTQSSKRTIEMEQYQQFSTPPNIAYVASWVADVGPEDTVLEPSAGIGGLAVFAKAKGATVIVNELSTRRLEILRNMPFDGFYNENAEHIDNILPSEVRPTVVIMNPPFSATGGRTANNSTANAKLHVEQALERLEKGGRLVAIVGHTMGEDFSTFASWWKDIKSKYNVKANITIDGSNYKKYGTTYSINMVVIDKDGPTTGNTLTGQYVDLADVIRALEGIKNDRHEARIRQVQQNANKPVRQTNNGPTGGGGRIGGSSHSGTNASSGGRSGTTNTGRTPISDNQTDTDAVQKSNEDVDSGRGAVDNSGNDEILQRPDGHSDVPSGRSDVTSGKPRGSSEIKLEQNTNKKVVDTENIDKVFSDYTPSKVKIKGSKPHKGKLSESTAMGAVLPPDPTYTPMIPDKIVNSGDLSDAQLEAIVYAGQSHEQMLPDETRRGFFIGDGTGVGKGREIAGIILDNYNRGRKKSVWISVNAKLFPDAQRDIEAMGMKADHIFKLPKVGAKVTKNEGTLFVPYGTFKMNQEKSGLHHQEYSPNRPYKLDLSIRIEQMVDWLGHDFDGVIVFDEAHKMGNAIGVKGSRGKTKPSQTALAGLLLQSKLPNARVVYVSATGASEITNLAYLSRVGLWGDGTPFANVVEFINAIGSGGLSAMEIIAKDMKAMGAYVARSLSYDDVTYERVEHQLTGDQHEAYGIMANAWQIVMQNMERALETTNAPGRQAGNARGAFWGSEQRFFNQILLANSMPTTLDHIEKDVKAGNTVVIQLTSTNEALMNRQVAKADEEDVEYEDLDMSPRDILIEYLKKSFPVEQYEDYTDEFGNVKKRPVLDSQGKPVLNRAAVRDRDDLIERIGAINMPDAPIDMIINKFGTKNVAEITGRSKRLERTTSSNGSEKVILAKRTDAVRDKELDDFINDKRKILIFSQAGGTGKSYHASYDYKNNHKRVHYMLESGFNVMNAMQGLGRTHRTNQKSAPHVKLITTSVPGHKRFISTIARRFDQLGALTRGQREAASQGLFSEKDNLEGPTARDALRAFYTALIGDRLEQFGLTSDEVLEKMGLTRYLINEWGQMKSDAPELTDVRKFLNRLLVLEIELQDRVFDIYSQILEQSVERAIERGTLDVGLENFKAASVELAEEITVRKDSRTGAETKIVTFDIKEDVETLAFDDLDIEISNFKGFYKNTRSGIVRAYYKSKSVTDDTGRVETSYRAYEPEKGKIQRVKESELTKDTMEKVTLEEARELWGQQLKDVPRYKESQKNLITGVLLPIWDKVTNTDEKTRVMRIITNDGSEHLGLLIKEDRVDVILGKLNVRGTQKTYAAEDVYRGVFNDNKIAGLSNGWRIKRSRVAGDNRIEIVGPDYSFINYLRRIGVFTELISNKTRYFIPINESQAIRIIEDIISTRTVTRLYSNNDEERASISVTAGAMPKNVMSNEAKKKSEPKGISEIIKDIERDFSIVITSKRYKNSRGASGFYRVHSEAIRVKVDNNINVISHELGHHLDKKYGLSDRYYKYISEMRDKLDLSSAYKEEEIPGEVIAEFIRLYLTTDDKAKELSESFYNAFMETIDKEDLKKLNKHKKDITDWFKSTTRDRVKSTQKSHTEKKKRVMSEEAIKAEMYLFDDLAPIKALTERVEEMTGQKIKVSDNPYVLALNTRRAGMIAKNIILNGLTDTKGEIIGKSMKEVLSGINRDDMDDFDAYLKARHAVTLSEYDIRVFSDEFDMADILELVEEYEEEFPEFIEIADELYQWWGTFIEEWVVKPGFMSEEAWKDLQARYPTYVPNFRVMDDKTRGTWAKRGFGNQHSPIKKIKGSAKDTYSVIESMMLYADKIVKVQKRNETGQAVHKLYSTVEGLSEYLEKVAPESEKHKFNAMGLKETLLFELATEFESKLDNSDKAKASTIKAFGDYNKYIAFLISKGFTADVIIDNTIDDIITYFTIKSFSTDSTVFTVVDEYGNSHFYYSKDPLFLEAMLNIDGRKMDDFVMLLSGMKRVFTTLTTGANPMFALFSNIWADVPEAMVYGDYKNPFEFGKALFKAMADTAVHLQKQYRHKNTYENYGSWGSEAKAYKAMGGGFSSQISDQRNLMTEMLNSVFPDMKKSSIKAMAEYAIELVEQFNDTIETAPRLAIYNKAIQEYGDTYEGRLLAMYKASEATTNFLRRGKLHYTAIGQGVPFLNAGLQGLYKLNREFGSMKGVDKNDITADGKRVRDMKAFRSVLAKALLYVTMFEVSQMIAYDDDDDYKNLPEYTKDGYYLFKMGDGKFFKIRKPRALSILFGSSFRRGFMSIAKGDEKAWEGFKESFMDIVMPPNPLTDNIFSPLIQAYANKSWTGAPIVSKGMEYGKKSDQFDTNTTEIAKFIARGLSDKFGIEVSPKKMDYVFQQYSGVIGQFAIPMMSKNKTVAGMFQQKMVADVAFSNDLISSFYDTKMALDEAYSSYNKSGRTSKDFDPVKRYRYGKVAEELSLLYDQIDEVKANLGLTPKEKQTQERDIRKKMLELTSEENLKPTSFDEFKVLYNRGSDITSKYKKQYAETGIKPNYTEDEAVLLNMYNIKVQDGRSELGYVNYQAGQIDKRIDEIQAKNTIPEAQKNAAIKKLEETKKKLTDDYMAYYKKNYGIEIVDFFK